MINTVCPDHVIAAQIASALAEDLGNNGDLTAQLLPIDAIYDASIITRDNMVLCGTRWVESAFAINSGYDSLVNIDWYAKDGDYLKPNDVICKIKGNARLIVTLERTILNFLQLLSATSTVTRKYVDAIHGTKTVIMDTRKTIPGLRLAQKYAVLVGGGDNQRLGLYDGILIKENHIAVCGGVSEVMQAARNIGQHSIQIEVETCEQLILALDAGARCILLDNMSITDINRCVDINKGRAILEASGGITLENVRQYALTGVDRISIGSITKNICAIDLSLRIESLLS